MPKSREVKSVKTSNASLDSLPKSLRSKSLRSSKYFDLFKLEKQKEVLVTENEMLSCKLKKNHARLDVIERQIQKIKDVQQPLDRKVSTVKDISDDHLKGRHSLKTMKLGY